MKLKKGTYKEIGKHFLTIAVVFLSVGLITPLFQAKELSLISMLGSLAVWGILFMAGIYLINRGEENE
jgi:hypothetical protein